MTTPSMTDQQLLDYSGEHLLHELSMLWELSALLPQKKVGTETSALVESFGIHLRNLIDFFYRDGRGDDVTAQDFLDSHTKWKPVEPVSLTNGHKRANKELSHLTQARISGDPPEKAWVVEALLLDIDSVAKEFAVNASTKRLHSAVRDFLQLPPDRKLAWIRANVTHMNIAAPTVVRVFSAESYSTHTQLAPTKLDLGDPQIPRVRLPDRKK